MPGDDEDFVNLIDFGERAFYPCEEGDLAVSIRWVGACQHSQEDHIERVWGNRPSRMWSLVPLCVDYPPNWLCRQ